MLDLRIILIAEIFDGLEHISDIDRSIEGSADFLWREEWGICLDKDAIERNEFSSLLYLEGSRIGDDTRESKIDFIRVFHTHSGKINIFREAVDNRLADARLSYIPERIISRITRMDNNGETISFRQLNHGKKEDPLSFFLFRFSARFEIVIIKPNLPDTNDRFSVSKEK